eukprot:CAMPEP_0181195408 /NCGR_PEP_ID=MMETSP1096-20121128/14871_1 /TAXON_ID=156174 ORGANISM="Chrysochromulina ericina, Strain CCMP281" /NCGR_SAMPLE_ID=MMETSP1096 /ASSEMBLY_ACC=CAM_ASM_000453 /LENGTH=189 /DNA_ID=CAMNT_0023285009 /DNA_START=1246 /DNA_END=1814 /DNA_ORIENTATION=-
MDTESSLNSLPLPPCAGGSTRDQSTQDLRPAVACLRSSKLMPSLAPTEARNAGCQASTSSSWQMQGGRQPNAARPMCSYDAGRRPRSARMSLCSHHVLAALPPHGAGGPRLRVRQLIAGAELKLYVGALSREQPGLPLIPNELLQLPAFLTDVGGVDLVSDQLKHSIPTSISAPSHAGGGSPEAPPCSS